jgi:hypothetical protein
MGIQENMPCRSVNSWLNTGRASARRNEMSTSRCSRLLGIDRELPGLIGSVDNNQKAFRLLVLATPVAAFIRALGSDEGKGSVIDKDVLLRSSLKNRMLSAKSGCRLTSRTIPGKGADFTSSRFGLGPPNGIQSFHLTGS